MVRSLSLKGQIMSSDFLVAFFLFLILFIAVTIAWNGMLDSSITDIERKYMESIAMRITDIFVKSPGYPSNWENREIVAIGLVDHDRRIDQAKLDAFMNMDYETSKDVLGIKGYDYFFRLVRNNVTKGYLGGETAIFIERRVLYNGDDRLEFILWK